MIKRGMILGLSAALVGLLILGTVALAATLQVKDITPGLAASVPDRLTNVGGTLFFVAKDGTAVTERWQRAGPAAASHCRHDVGARGTESVGGTSGFSSLAMGSPHGTLVPNREPRCVEELSNAPKRGSTAIAMPALSLLSSKFKPK